MAPKGRQFTRTLEGTRISLELTQERQSESEEETRSHMLKEEGCGDETSDFRAVPWLLAKVCFPRVDDVMTCKMQYNTLPRLESGGCQQKSK